MRGRGIVWMLAAAAFVFAGCSDDGKDPAGCPVPGRTAALFIVNGLGETLTRYEIATRTVDCRGATLGPGDVNAAPNAALVHGDRLYVVNSTANTVDVFTLPGLSRAGEIDLGAGSNPWAIAVSGDHAFVTNLLADDIARVDLATLEVAGRFPAGDGPEGLAVAAGRVFVANTALRITNEGVSYGPGLVTVHDAATGQAQDTLSVGVNPQAVLVDSAGIVNVLCTGDYGAVAGRVFFIDPEGPAVVDSLDLGSAPGFAALADSGKVYVAAWGFDPGSNGLMLYDALRRVVLRGPADPVLREEGLEGLAFDPVEERLYVADFDDDAVRVIDTSVGSIIATFPAGDGPDDCEIYRP